MDIFAHHRASYLRVRYNLTGGVYGNQPNNRVSHASRPMNATLGIFPFRVPCVPQCHTNISFPPRGKAQNIARLRPAMPLWVKRVGPIVWEDSTYDPDHQVTERVGPDHPGKTMDIHFWTSKCGFLARTSQDGIFWGNGHVTGGWADNQTCSSLFSQIQ